MTVGRAPWPLLPGRDRAPARLRVRPFLARAPVAVVYTLLPAPTRAISGPRAPAIVIAGQPNILGHSWPHTRTRARVYGPES